MKGNPDETMVIAGQHGGKSTFLGALATKLRKGKAKLGRGKGLVNETVLSGDYDVLYGEEREFEKKIRKRMAESLRYPDQTNRPDAYVVKFKLHESKELKPTVDIAVMDVPGEAQEGAINRLLDDKKCDPSEVHEKYNDTGVNSSRGAIRERVDSNQGLTPDEWEWAYLYRYMNAQRVIFLVNLEKILDRQDLEFIITESLIKRVSQDKKCLLLFTATDRLSYNPDEFDVNSRSLSIKTKNFDKSLAARLDRELPTQNHNMIMSLLRTAKNEGVDMFGVAVPPKSGTDEIKTDGGDIVLQGFDNIGDWLEVE